MNNNLLYIDGLKIISAKPNEWDIHGSVYIDNTLPEPFNVRLETGQNAIKSLAVNIKFSGRKEYDVKYTYIYKRRAKITFVGDCEPDVVTRGFVYYSY